VTYQRDNKIHGAGLTASWVSWRRLSAAQVTYRQMVLPFVKDVDVCYFKFWSDCEKLKNICQIFTVLSNATFFFKKVPERIE
jgi:hypothetical protein